MSWLGVTDELRLARRHRRTAQRREARLAWANRLHMSVEIGWPRGVLGAICGAILLLTPPALLILGVWIELRLRGRRVTVKRDDEPRGAA